MDGERLYKGAPVLDHQVNWARTMYDIERVVDMCGLEACEGSSDAR